MNFTDQERKVELESALADAITGVQVDQSIILEPFGISILIQELAAIA